MTLRIHSGCDLTTRLLLDPTAREPAKHLPQTHPATPPAPYGHLSPSVDTRPALTASGQAGFRSSQLPRLLSHASQRHLYLSLARQTIFTSTLYCGVYDISYEIPRLRQPWAKIWLRGPTGKPLSFSFFTILRHSCAFLQTLDILSTIATLSTIFTSQPPSTTTPIYTSAHNARHEHLLTSWQDATAVTTTTEGAIARGMPGRDGSSWVS